MALEPDFKGLGKVGCKIFDVQAHGNSNNPNKATVERQVNEFFDAMPFVSVIKILTTSEKLLIFYGKG